MDMQTAIDLYADMLAVACPCAFLFATCNIVVNIFLNAFCNGKLKIGGK